MPFSFSLSKFFDKQQFLSKPKREYKAAFQKAIQQMVSWFNADFTFRAEHYIPIETVNNSLVFPIKGLKVKGEDYVSGKIGECHIEFSEISLYTGPDSSSNAQIFRGLFLVVDFQKDFSSVTVMRPQDFKWMMAQEEIHLFKYNPDSRLQDNSLDQDLDQVHLEDPEIEALYNFYSSDQVGARYIFTPSLIGRINRFRRKWGEGIFIAFRDSKMYLAVPSSDGIFEPPMHKKQNISTEDALRNIFDDLTNIFGIVDDLNLNRQIWK